MRVGLIPTGLDRSMSSVNPATASTDPTDTSTPHIQSNTKQPPTRRAPSPSGVLPGRLGLPLIMQVRGLGAGGGKCVCVCVCVGGGGGAWAIEARWMHVKALCTPGLSAAAFGVVLLVVGGCGVVEGGEGQGGGMRVDVCRRLMARWAARTLWLSSESVGVPPRIKT